MEKAATTNNYLSNYLYNIRSKGRYAFTLIELKEAFDVSDKALQQNIYRLKIKNQIAQIRQGFYTLIPPEHSHRAMLPYYLFIDDLMKFLKRDYYIGLYSAAALHGAGHQQPMESHIITEKPALRAIKNEKLAINFSVKSKWDKETIVKKKTDAGYIKVSSPELTALDLVCFSYKIGGINRILPILEELGEIVKPSLLSRAAKKYNQIASIQRLGFLFEALGYNKLASILLKFLQDQKYYSIPLSVLHKGKTANTNTKWKIITNVELNN